VSDDCQFVVRASDNDGPSERLTHDEAIEWADEHLSMLESLQPENDHLVQIGYVGANQPTGMSTVTGNTTLREGWVDRIQAVAREYSVPFRYALALGFFMIAFQFSNAIVGFFAAVLFIHTVLDVGHPTRRHPR
jgi:alanine-alpha-ketoisovalerate/valine-pyruvate aminotransferase